MPKAMLITSKQLAAATALDQEKLSIVLAG